ncbi:hypothetical protein [Sandarakinorhabdus sp.]|uniref:hypothetical protein n=1 Tax=Sandarakinorhabdus sp. TaxID=1916663 RepID=UPI00286E8F12|nr:hypothetical protein [Sandarakinorhabdus sp.]
MKTDATTWAVAVAGAAAIAATGFAAAQLLGEGAGMPLVALGATLWTAGFVRWSASRRPR